MYHLCLQYISSKTREESALVPVVPLYGGRGRIRYALPFREVVGELTVRYQIIIEYKSYFYGFQRNAFPQKRVSTKGFSTKCFPRNAFQEMQENHDGEKERKPRLLILSVRLISRQQILDISAHYLTNNRGV